MFLPILSAVLGVAAFPPFNLWPLGFVFLAPFFIFLATEKKFWRFVSGVFAFRIVLMTAVGYFAFDPIIYGLSSLLFTTLLAPLFFLKKRKLLFVTLPFFYAFADLLSDHFSFLPTNVIAAGNILGASPFLGLANFGGLTSLTFFTAAINALITILILNFNKLKIKNIIFVSILAAIIIAGWQTSQIQLQKNSLNYQNKKNELTLALVSTSAEIDKKFSGFNNTLDETEREKIEMGISQILSSLKKELDGGGIDILALPEDMIDIEDWNNSDEQAENKFGIENDKILIQNYRTLAQELNVNLTTTFTTYQDKKRYNTALLFNRMGEVADIYNKSRLTIASEYWPFGDWQPFYYKWARRIQPDIGNNSAIFNKEYQYSKGERKNLRAENFSFASPICLEIHYPYEVKQFKKMGADFILHTTSNTWITYGLKNYLALTENLRKIESVWLKTPIVFNGKMEKAGIITPDGKIQSIDFKTADKNYNILIGKIKY
jgi:apolipoprotein N-acyltransferase